MKAIEVYIGATKATLIAVLEAALRDVRDAPEGAVSVPIYAAPGEGYVTLTDEETANDEPGTVTIET